MNKEYDETDQIDKGYQLDKKVENPKEGLTGSNEVLKLGIMISQSCIDKDYDERYQIYNDDHIEKKISENDE